jgi:catechol 2,3-dioxygenase-like lactoylglutathione lyase family enzyme
MKEFPTTGMEITNLLVVSSLAQSKQWYREVLGAEVYRQYETSCVLRLLDTWLLLVTGGGPTPDKPSVEFVPPLDPDRVSRELIFRVPDCRAAYEELKSRGAHFLAPPVDRGYEMRAFFRDPDGHLFEISEVPGG